MILFFWYSDVFAAGASDSGVQQRRAEADAGVRVHAGPDLPLRLAPRLRAHPAPHVCTVCPRSSDPFYIVTYYIKLVTTSWTHSTSLGKINIIV